MKRWLWILALGLLVATMVSCQSETSSSEPWTTGTYFMWRQQVMDHFDQIAFSTFDFVDAREYTSASTPEAFVTLAVNGNAVKQEVLAIFEGFDGSQMFPSHATGWAKFVLRFESETESMTITFLHRDATDGTLSFLHANDQGLIESQAYPYSAFPEEVTALLSLFTLKQEI
jgi:hypothetical protein